ncbi:hypothetical protein DFA_03859 [Cavenderia fasciculata]|uniref:Uncharacterized protein n=1 Tax=Cavenderia fasciculata TaxID=261658 RepID=F4Q0L4_CACFS|nr:uncharacterized protein DFA_03859 [Cavenderia fasciculata]EGG18365.1 hypothetical protein DFA_03859 [Cavenderia fasciculata]|eukprot:XP_004366269.1 hypothetical protein DFA_03859 [Cavenderia fasciculata]
MNRITSRIIQQHQLVVVGTPSLQSFKRFISNSSSNNRNNNNDKKNDETISTTTTTNKSKVIKITTADPQSLKMYRKLIRASYQMPLVASVRNKIRVNAKEMWDFHRQATQSEQTQLLNNANSILIVLLKLSKLPEIFSDSQRRKDN